MTGLPELHIGSSSFLGGGSKVIKGSFWNPKKSTILNGKNNSVNVLHMDRHAKVSTVTSSSDLSLRGQRSKKVKM